MLGRLFVLFVIVPLVELALLLLMADVTGWEVTLLLVVVTGGVGIWLARMQGFQTWQRIQTEMARGQVPADSLLDAVLILMAGTLLLTPGILTDAFGLSLLVPPCRRLYRTWLVRWFQKRVSVQYRTSVRTEAQDESSQIIDSYVVDQAAGEGDETPGDT